MKQIWLHTILCCISLYSLSAQPAGTLDPSFNGVGYLQHRVDSNETNFNNIALQQDGNILVTGFAYDTLGYPRNFLMRLLADGTPDPSFADNGYYQQPGIYYTGDTKELPDNKIQSVMQTWYGNQIAIRRLWPDGTPDTLFGPGGVVRSTVAVDYYFEPRKMHLLPDGKAIVLGIYPYPNSNNDNGILVKVLENGRIDSTFGTNGVVKLAIPGASGNIWIENFNIQPDGKIVVPGRIGDTSFESKWYVARFLPDGSLDPDFADGGVLIYDFGDQNWEGATDVTFLPDGRMIVAGYAPKHPSYCFTLLRLSANGVVDNTFGFGGKGQLAITCCSSVPYDIERQEDGKYVLSGIGYDASGKSYFCVGRFKASGAVDATFGNGGLALSLGDATDQRSEAFLIQPDKKILAVGNTLDVDGFPVSGLVARLTSEAVSGSYEPESGADYSPELIPNPIGSENPTLRYQLPEPATVGLELYDNLGRKVSTVLKNAPRSSGEQNEAIQLPEGLKNGVYFLKIETEYGIQTISLIKNN